MPTFRMYSAFPWAYWDDLYPVEDGWPAFTLETVTYRAIKAGDETIPPSWAPSGNVEEALAKMQREADAAAEAMGYPLVEDIDEEDEEPEEVDGGRRQYEVVDLLLPDDESRVTPSAARAAIAAYLGIPPEEVVIVLPDRQTGEFPQRP